MSAAHIPAAFIDLLESDALGHLATVPDARLLRTGET